MSVSNTVLSQEFEVAVVGCGLVGAACAAELARAGCRVVVLEQGPVGGGATGVGMGHVAVLDDSPAQLALTSYSRRLWQALAPQLPARAEADRCGTLWVATDAQEVAVLERKRTRLAQAGVAATMLSAADLAREEPRLRRGLAGGLLVPDDLVVYPPVVARWLLEQACGAGAEFRGRARVVHLHRDGRVRLQDDTTIRARRVINAAGSWAPRLSRSIPIRPCKGHLVITHRYPAFVRHQLMELGRLESTHGAEREAVALHVQPRRTGQLLIGASYQADVVSSEVEMRLVTKMVRRTVSFLPAVIDLVAMRMWAGHRAATPDRLPLIGPSVDRPRVWWATGHDGWGVTAALATARLIADLYRGGSSAIDVAPYLPGRLAHKE